MDSRESEGGSSTCSVSPTFPPSSSGPPPAQERPSERSQGNKWQLHFYSEGGWRGEEGEKDGWIDGGKRNSFQVAKGIDRGTTSFKATCRAVVPVGFYFFAPCAVDRNSRTLLLKLTIFNLNLFHYYLFIYLGQIKSDLETFLSIVFV